MPDSIDYRQYLEAKFEGLAKHMNAQFEIIHNNLDAIKEQTTKTNHRVNHLEEQKEEYLKSRVDINMFKEIRDDLVELEREVRDELPHTIDICPQRNIIQEIRDDMITTKALKTSTQRTIIITGVIIGAIYSLTMLILKIIENHDIFPSLIAK